MRWIAIALVVACSTPNEEPKPKTQAPVAPTAAKPDTSFGLYVLALSWAPSFCCAHPSKEECSDLEGAFAGTHLTLHGLWPNYTDDEAKKHDGETYPQFCGDFARCKNKKNDKTCFPDPATLPEEMRMLGPGYVGDHDFLADHEWPKHGSCTNLAAGDYFKDALAAMKALPGEGTPDALRSAITDGGVALADLEKSFGVPKESVLLSCDPKCRLQQVSFCLAHDAKNVPTKPIACPVNATKAQYDNGCVTQGCTTVTVPAANSCAPANNPPPVGKCSHSGQGPVCTTDTNCTKQGWLRCAKSGCCTNQKR
jgi:ribonuclease T2